MPAHSKWEVGQEDGDWIPERAFRREFREGKFRFLSPTEAYDTGNGDARGLVEESDDKDRVIGVKETLWNKLELDAYVFGGAFQREE